MTMIKNKTLKKVLGFILSAAVIGSTLITGATADAEITNPVIENLETTGDATYIGSYIKRDYNGFYNAIEISFRYNEVQRGVDYNDTFQFLVFDTAWGGWDPTHVGPNGVDQTGAVEVEEDKIYTVTVPIDLIESKLSNGGTAFGINLQTGIIEDTSVTITEMEFLEGYVESEPIVMEGEWKRTAQRPEYEEFDYGYMNLTSGYAEIHANQWNLAVYSFSVKSFKNPVVAVTVEYNKITGDYIHPQSEVLDSKTYEPIVQNYPKVSETGTVTYLTEIPRSMTSMHLAFDTCVVKKVEIYDGGESNQTEINNLTNETIIKAMGAGWNLGNALDSTSEGEVDETLWSNPEINKRLFKQIAKAGFKTVRIPTTWLDAVTVSEDGYLINKTKFNKRISRLKEVVDMARDYDLFVIINVHHDGSEGITGRWLDVDDAVNQRRIKAAYGDLWERIAIKFAEYDQHLIFESMDEVMEEGNYGTPSAATWKNINALNQIFVDSVREAVAGKNQKRFLLVPGYNTDIDQTVTNSFKMPTYNGSTDYEMVSCHFYDPYDFTLNTGRGSKTYITEGGLDIIETQFAKLKANFLNNGIPVVISEFCVADKNNYDAISTYISKVVEQAKAKGLGYVYWDNGYSGQYGMGLWNRYTYGQTRLGNVIIPILTN